MKFGTFWWGIQFISENIIDKIRIQDLYNDVSKKEKCFESYVGSFDVFLKIINNNDLVPYKADYGGYEGCVIKKITSWMYSNNDCHIILEVRRGD